MAATEDSDYFLVTLLPAICITKILSCLLKMEIALKKMKDADKRLLEDRRLTSYIGTRLA